MDGVRLFRTPAYFTLEEDLVRILCVIISRGVHIRTWTWLTRAYYAKANIPTVRLLSHAHFILQLFKSDTDGFTLKQKAIAPTLRPVIKD